VGALDKLEGFCAQHGANFYNLPQPPPPQEGEGGEGSRRKKVVLKRETTKIPASYPFGAAGDLIPLRAGETVAWAVHEAE
jgi:dihydroorotase